MRAFAAAGWIFRTACVVLLLASHLEASALAADCAMRCAHSCCRVRPTGGAPASHCAMPGHGGAVTTGSCGIQSRCDHSRESAITALPLLVGSDAPACAPPLASRRELPTLSAGAGDRTQGIEAPPPRPVA